MFKVDADYSDVYAMHREALKSLDRAPEQMKKILDRKAAEERRTHRYQNRTTMLEKSTFASEVKEMGDAKSVEFGARMHYASYVDNRGLTRVHQLAQAAAREIEFFLDGESERVSRM